MWNKISIASLQHWHCVSSRAGLAAVRSVKASVGVKEERAVDAAKEVFSR